MCPYRLEFKIRGGKVLYTCHVFILTPFIVFCSLTSRTVTLDTHAFVSSRPSPPMLIPWPGPQLTLCMYTPELPVCMDIQSSPVVQIFIYVSFIVLLII